MNKEEALELILNTYHKPYAHVRMKQSTFSTLVNRIKNGKASLKKEIEFFNRFGIKVTTNLVYEIEIFNPLNK